MGGGKERKGKKGKGKGNIHTTFSIYCLIVLFSFHINRVFIFCYFCLPSCPKQCVEAERSSKWAGVYLSNSSF